MASDSEEVMSMDAAKILKLTFFIVFLVLNTKMCQPYPVPAHAPPPLCISQFALASHACAMLPYPFPPPPDEDGGDHTNRHRHGHGHGHGHRHRHGHHESPKENDCCHLLKEVDSRCVCNLLARLPPLLSKWGHSYTLKVDESCNVTFHCGDGGEDEKV